MTSRVWPSCKPWPHFSSTCARACSTCTHETLCMEVRRGVQVKALPLRGGGVTRSSRNRMGCTCLLVTAMQICNAWRKHGSMRGGVGIVVTLCMQWNYYYYYYCCYKYYNYGTTMNIKFVSCYSLINNYYCCAMVTQAAPEGLPS